MKPPLFSNDAVTEVLNGEPTDFVPVAQAYEMLGPLESWWMERKWRIWSERLDAAGTDHLPVDFQTYFDTEYEMHTEMLDTLYPRPAWRGVVGNSSEDHIRGSAVVRRDGELFWLWGDGSAEWMPPSIAAEREVAAVEAHEAPRQTDMWDQEHTFLRAVQRAAARHTHELRPLPPPMEEQAEALAASPRYELARRLVARYPDAMPLYAWGNSPYESLPGRLGFQNAMYALLEQPKLAHRIIENALPQFSARRAADRLLGVRILFIQECWASADIISPKMYREFVFPYDKQAIQMWEDMGFRTVLYFSGNLMPLLPDLAKLPFTAICFEEDRKNYGTDLAEVRRALPDKVLFGNVDATFLEQASDREVLDEVRRQIKVAGADGKFILSAGSPITPGTSLERLKLFCESTRMI